MSDTGGFENSTAEGADDDYDSVAVDKVDTWYVSTHVYDKVFNVSCGDGSQRIKWLAHVGIGKFLCGYNDTLCYIIYHSSARWDDANYQGWKRLGIPTAVRLNHKDGEEVDMALTIREAIRPGDHIFVETSIPPSFTK